MVYLLSGSGREPKHHLQLHSVTGGPTPPSIMPSPLLTLKNQAHIQRLSQTEVFHLSHFLQEPRFPALLFPQSSGWWPRATFSTGASSGSKPLPAHMPSSVGSDMPILVWVFPLQNVSVTSPVCDAYCKELTGRLAGLRHLS